MLRAIILFVSGLKDFNCLKELLQGKFKSFLKGCSSQLFSLLSEIKFIIILVGRLFLFVSAISMLALNV
jgi:hypothetical protein